MVKFIIVLGIFALGLSGGLFVVLHREATTPLPLIGFSPSPTMLTPSPSVTITPKKLAIKTPSPKSSPKLTPTVTPTVSISPTSTPSPQIVYIPSPVYIYLTPSPVSGAVGISSPTITPSPTLSPSASSTTTAFIPPPLKIANCRNDLSDGVYEVRQGLEQSFNITYTKPVNSQDYTWYAFFGTPGNGKGSNFFTKFTSYGKHRVTIEDIYGQKDTCWVNIIE